MHLQFTLIYFALENLIPRDKFGSSKNTPQDTVCNAIIIPGRLVVPATKVNHLVKNSCVMLDFKTILHDCC